MASPKNQERGIRKSQSFRSGIDLPYWQGLNLDQDPGAIRDAELQAAVNVRLNAGRIDCRGGQQKLTDAALDGCIWSVDDLPLPTVALYLTPTFNGQNPLERYNLDLDPNYSILYQNTDLSIADPLAGHRQFRGPAPCRRDVFVWRARLFVHNTRQISEVVLPKDNEDGAVSLRPFINLGVDQAHDFAIVSEAREDILYIGSLSNQEVYRYDGVWLSTDGAIAPAAGRMILGRWHDRLYICGPQYLMVRNPGPPLVNGLPAPGSYSTIPMPGTVTTFLPSRIIEWKDWMFIVGLDASIVPAPGVPGPGCILMYDGSTVTMVRQPVNDSNAPFTPAVGISDGIVFNNKFWYLWMDTDNVTLVGSFDGTTWNDREATIGVAETPVNCGDFVAANGLLYLTTIMGQPLDPPSLSNSQVVFSSPDGTNWTLVKNITGINSDYACFPGDGAPNIVAFGVVT